MRIRGNSDEGNILYITPRHFMYNKLVVYTGTDIFLSFLTWIIESNVLLNKTRFISVCMICFVIQLR